MNLNKAFILGNITRDPELKQLPSGISVCSFSIATNKIYTDKSGQKQQQVEYHNIVVFGRMAETTAQYMRKGSQILIEGRIQTRSWEANDGTKKYRTEIIAESVQFGEKPKDSNGESSARKQVENYDKDDGNDDIEYPEDDMNPPEDIPF